MSFGPAHTPGKNVAVKPFEDTSSQVKTNRGLALMETKIGLKKLEVVFDNHELGVQAGDQVYVPSDVVNRHAWAKAVYEAQEKSFILVPETFVLVVLPKQT